jgi:very-short-patch-repair endonuclease/predicted transcriptional regulator of viral defense system
VTDAGLTVIWTVESPSAIGMHNGRGRDGGAPGREREVAALAARQHGVVTRGQLLQAGLSADAIDNRVKTKWLRLMHRGVYAVGPVAAPDAMEMAAVLACGEGAVLSCMSAARLWHLVPYPAHDRAIDVTVPAGRDRRRPGIRVHRVCSLERDEVTELKGIPVTIPARTLLDLATAATPRELERAAAEAERRQLASRSKLLALIARYPRRPGTRALRVLLERQGRPALTRSEAEERFMALARRGRLPAPDVNVLLGSYEVDFLWREERLVVEVDGFAFHGSRAKFEGDRRRDAELAAQGLQVIRVTWRQIVDEPEAMLVRIAQALARAGPS